MRFSSSLRRTVAEFASRIPINRVIWALPFRTCALQQHSTGGCGAGMTGKVQLSGSSRPVHAANALRSPCFPAELLKPAQRNAHPCKPVGWPFEARFRNFTCSPNREGLLVSTYRRATHTRSPLLQPRNVSHFAVSNKTLGEQKVEDMTQHSQSEDESEEAVRNGNDTVEDEEDGDGDDAGVSLPQASGVRVKTAEFISSVVKRENCPPEKYPEFAVIGRSNVGKSSLINMLTGRKSLAMVSKTPGKTQTINHFLVNKEWYLVDLPGYGYAKTAPKSNQFQWNQFTKDYFLNRGTLVVVLLLVDSSIPPQEIDLKCAKWLTSNDVPFIIVFTKADKRKKGSTRAENIEGFMDYVRLEWTEPPPHFVTSSEKGIGKQELLTHIAQLRNFWLKG